MGRALGVALAVFVLFLITPHAAYADGPARTQEIIRLIEGYAAEYGADAGAMIRVARCESGLNPNDIGDGGASRGVFQWHRRGLWWDTPFAKYGLAGRLVLEYDLRAAAWAFAQGYQRHWTCWRKIYGRRH